MSILSKVFTILTIILSVLGFAIIFMGGSATNETRYLEICYGFSLAVIPYIISRSIKDLT